MKLINRSALAVLPRKPFADWANAQQDELNQPMSLEEHRAEGSVYLVEEFESEADIQKQLEQHYQVIFENELSAWDEFADNWPDNRSLELFNQWFEVVPQLITADLLQAPLLLASIDE